MKGFIFKVSGEVMQICRILWESDLLSPERSFWFAWNETHIVLPAKLLDPQEIEGEWEVIRAFSERVELRGIKRDGRISVLLLTEGEAPPELGVEGSELIEIYPTVLTSNRLLWGERMRFQEREVRGVAVFPRVLDYGVEGSLEMALAAEVYSYLDDQMRLRHTRYRAIKPVPLGSITVKPFGR
jgi:hypothetical protein